eukprot:m.90448 g.90448  ORF g.90448 m.90448 type:complete len:608 (+) comp15261_c3_seq2:402-2225(+)
MREPTLLRRVSLVFECFFEFLFEFFFLFFLSSLCDAQAKPSNKSQTELLKTHQVSSVPQFIYKLKVKHRCLYNLKTFNNQRQADSIEDISRKKNNNANLVCVHALVLLLRLGSCVVEVHVRKVLQHLIDVDLELVVANIGRRRLCSRIAVDVDGAAQIGVLLELLNVSLHVLLCSLLFATRGHLLLLGEELELPVTLLVRPPLVRVALLHQNHLRDGVQLQLLRVVVVVVGRSQIDAECVVARVQHVAEVCAHDKRGVVHAHVTHTGHRSLGKHVLLERDGLAVGGADGLNVQHGKLCQLVGRGQGAEWCLPVVEVGDLRRLQRKGVEHVDGGADVVDNGDGVDAAVVAGDRSWQTHNVIAADGHNLHGVGVLEVEDVCVDVVGDELLRCLRTDRHDSREELLKALGVTVGGEEEVDAVWQGLDAHSERVLVVLDDHLLQVEEGALMLDLLAHLHDCVPCVLGLGAVARGAHLVLHDVLDDKHLLQNGVGKDLLLHGELGLDALGVRLCPHKAGVDEADLVQALEAFEAERQQLARLERSLDPSRGRAEIALAVAAEKEIARLRDAFCDVDARADANGAHGRRVGRDLGAALAAENEAAGRRLGLRL